MHEESLNQIKLLISQQTGLRLTLECHEQLQKVVRQRMQAMKLASFDEYFQRLQGLSQPELMREHEELAISLTNGETFFFRDKGQISVLSEQILPELIERNRLQKRLRLWSAGCSSGEEAYSLAMLLDELPLDLASWDITILGTDINPLVLAKAKAAKYSEWSFRQVSEQRRQRYFERQQDCWQLKQHIRQQVQFLPLNLATEIYPYVNGELKDMDLILCRNVFIYLEAEKVSQVASKLTDSLVTDGYLITGHNELYDHQLGNLRTRIFPHSIVYQKIDVKEPSKVLTEQLAIPVARPPVRFTAGIVKSQPAKPDCIEQAKHQALDLTTIWRYANEGQTEKAMAGCKSLIEQDPLSHQPYYLLALLSLEQGEAVVAKELLKKTIYLAPEFIAAYMDLADIYIKETNPSQAGKMFSTAQSLLLKLPEQTAVEMFGKSTAADMLEFIAKRLRDL